MVNHHTHGHQDILLASGFKLLICGLTLVMLTGCDDSTVDPDNSSAPTFTEIQADILNPDCTSCHSGENAAQGLDLSAGNAYDELVGVASSQVEEMNLVESGSPDDSYLIVKLEGGNQMAEGTSRMPLGGTQLSDQQIQQVRDWIAAGAAND